jgi:L-iditol 2-dehydrogenase
VKAVRKLAKGPGHVALVDVEPPGAPPPGWVTIDVRYAGICGTDVHILHDAHPYWPPVTLGHELAGTVAATGDGVDRPLGTRVVCEPHQGACTVCRLCRAGLHHLCPSKRSPGWGIDGAMAPRLNLPAHLLHEVPDELPDAAAAVCEPAAVCLTGLTRARVEAGDVVVVVGPGPIGLLSALIARALGAGRVIVAGRESSAGRLALARELGLETVDAGGAPDVEADLAVDASGSAGGLAYAVAGARRGGRLLGLGLAGAPTVPFPWDDAMRRSLDVTCSLSSAHASWEGALSLMRSGALDPLPLVEVFPLERWDAAFDAVIGRRVVKALLEP